MRKIFMILSLVLTFFIVGGCSVGDSQTNSENNTDEIVKMVISNYLDSLSKKDIEGLKKYSTVEWGKGFDQDIITELNKILQSAKLLKYTIRDNEADKIIADTEVEIICYEGSIPSGDWQTGRSVSAKAFELIKEDNEWKINGWGAY